MRLGSGLFSFGGNMNIYEFYDYMQQLAIIAAEQHKNDANLFNFYKNAAEGFKQKKNNLRIKEVAK